MTPTSELLLSAETIIFGFAVARLLHGAPGIFTLKKSSVSVIIVWIICCLHIATNLWSTTARFELRLDFFDFLLKLVFAGITFFMCDNLTPHNSDQIKSFTDHFNLIRKRYWLCHIGCCINIALAHEYTGIAKNIITREKSLLFYMVAILPWMLVSIFGLNAKTKNLQLIAVSLLLFLYLFNSAFTFLESSSIVK